jgi:hypothetical protein
MSAPRSVKVTLEGARAEAAARDLFSKGWFEAEWGRRADAASATVSPEAIILAQLVALAGGSVTIAEKLLAWWERWLESERTAGGRLTVVLESPSGKRANLATATRDALVEVLRVLHLPPR